MFCRDTSNCFRALSDTFRIYGYHRRAFLNSVAPLPYQSVSFGSDITPALGMCPEPGWSSRRSGDRTRYLGVFTVESPAKEIILPTHEDRGVSDTRNYPTDSTLEGRNLVYKLYSNVVIHVWESNPWPKKWTATGCDLFTGVVLLYTRTRLCFLQGTLP